MARQHIGWKLVQRNKRRLESFMIEVLHLRRIDVSDKHDFALPSINVLNTENAINHSLEAGFFEQLTKDSHLCAFATLQVTAGQAPRIGVPIHMLEDEHALIGREEQPNRTHIELRVEGPERQTHQWAWYHAINAGKPVAH